MSSNDPIEYFEYIGCLDNVQKTRKNHIKILREEFKKNIWNFPYLEKPTHSYKKCPNAWKNFRSEKEIHFKCWPPYSKMEKNNLVPIDYFSYFMQLIHFNPVLVTCIKIGSRPARYLCREVIILYWTPKNKIRSPLYS